MRISAVCNGALTIQANVNKAGDFDLASSIAAQMELDTDGDIVVTSECPDEQWVQVCAAWNYKQADDLKQAYKDAKKAVNQ